MNKNFFCFLSVLLISMFFGQSINAQSEKEEIELIQSIFGMEKKAMVAEFTGVESTDPFWALYDEYETKRKVLGTDRLAALMNYVESYDTMTDANYDMTIANMIALRKGNDKLMDQYYKKIKKASGSKVAAQFFQLEAYIATEIRAAILEGIPMIGEFGN